MKKYKNIIMTMLVVLCFTDIQAQIGYQVSLLNTATGEPRANVTVNAQVIITNAENELVYSCIQPSTSNDFGVLNFTIGNEDTFKDVDWNKLPFFIEVQVDGNTIGKSQILTVPVAEYAKKTGQLTKEILVGTWKAEYFYTYFYDTWHNKEHILRTIVFHNNGKFEYSSWAEWDSYHDNGTINHYQSAIDSFSGDYIINGNFVILLGYICEQFLENATIDSSNVEYYNTRLFYYDPNKNILCLNGESLLKQ